MVNKFIKLSLTALSMSLVTTTFALNKSDNYLSNLNLLPESNNTAKNHHLSQAKHLFLNQKLKELNIDLNATILDVSKSESSPSRDLVSSGAKKVYSTNYPNLSSNLKSNANQYSNEHIYLISKDFSKSKTVKKLLKQQEVGFIVGMNTLEHWSARQIDSELSRMYKGLKPGGAVLFNISNPFINHKLNESFYKNAYLNKSNLLLNSNNLSDLAMLNSAVNNLFKSINKHYPNYKLLPSSYWYTMNKRLVLYPFELVKTASNGSSNYSEIYHVLFPENMKIILERAGFTNVKIGKTNFAENSFYITGVKS